MLLLFLVIVVPTIGVLWFVGVAIRNEQLANRQRLTDVYWANLQILQQQIPIKLNSIQTLHPIRSGIADNRLGYLELSRPHS